MIITEESKKLMNYLKIIHPNSFNIIYTMILDFEVRSKILNIFKAHNPLEEYSVKIYKIDPYFYECYEKHLKFDDNERKHISFKIDIYFSDYSLAIEINKNGVDRDLMFEVKR